MQQDIYIIISTIGAWIICTIASERTAEAITESVFFSPLRQFLGRLSVIELYKLEDTNCPDIVYRGLIYSIAKKIGIFLSSLVSCGWCTSGWTSFFFSIFLPGQYISLNACDNIIVKAIALWGCSNLYHSVFRLIHNGRVSAIDINLKINGEYDGESGQRKSEEGSSTIEPE